ncbi:AhpC/TSA family protein [Bellilinea sp.]
MPCREHALQLQSAQPEFEQNGISIALVTFEEGYWLERWRETTQIHFTILLDPQKNLYQAFGLQRSIRRTWNLPTLWFYAQKLLRGEKLIATGGDLHQLGGDFILDQNGQIVLAYYSHDPTDRPQPNTLLQSIQLKG